jgi:DNA-binding transcriptional regulator YiaG
MHSLLPDAIATTCGGAGDASHRSRRAPAVGAAPDVAGTTTMNAASPVWHRRQTLDGNAIMRTRALMALRCEELAQAIGVDRSTLYRWEADGIIHKPYAPASYLLQWLAKLEPPELARITVRVRRHLDRGTVDRCAIELYACMGRSCP